MRLLFVVPLSDPPQAAAAGLAALAGLRRHGHRVVAVDGGVGGSAVAQAQALCDRVLGAPRGWFHQANAGSRAPEADSADALVFVPQDVRLPPEADRDIARALSRPAASWGWFDLERERAPGSAAPPLAQRAADALGNRMARLTRIALREQVLFVARSVFLALEGFDPEDPAPDAEFCRRAALLAAPAVLDARVRVPAVPAPAAWHAGWRAAAAREGLRLSYRAGRRAPPR